MTSKTTTVYRKIIHLRKWYVYLLLGAVFLAFILVTYWTDQVQESISIFTSNRRIPKIVHLSWKNSKLPGPTTQWVKRWTETNPDFDVYFWSDDDMKHFLSKFYPGFLRIFENYKTSIFRADAIRYFILFHFGGLYADLDVEPLKSIQPLLNKHACILAREPDMHAQLSWNMAPGNFMASNCFMGCRPRHPFMKLVMDLLEVSSDSTHPVVSTGPLFLTRVYKAYVSTRSHMANTNEIDNVFLAPVDYFNPTIDILAINTHKPKCQEAKVNSKVLPFCKNLTSPTWRNGPTRESYADHHWWHSWLGTVKETTEDRDITKIVPSVRMGREKCR